MLNYAQIANQLYPYVELYRESYPEESFFPEVISNISIYSESGIFVGLLRALVGKATNQKSDRFDELCLKYQTTKMVDIDEAEANELWDEFHRLTEK